ncbi:MAG: hypothetical protein R6X02_32830 [Enhygromyxa sp.]
MSDNSTLLVPMQLDALVINQPIQQSGETWNRWQMNYGQLNQYLDPQPAPFENQVWAPPAKGVHLHWTLPDGLSRGTQAEDGAPLTYPYVPNRWLIVRIEASGDPKIPPRSTAWVLVADAVSTEPGDEGAPFVDPFYTPSGDQPPVQPATLGRSMTLDAWNSGGGEGGITQVPAFLQALGPGDITFSAYAPGNAKVFSFHDELDGINQAQLSYLVIGWYSKADSNPLAGLDPSTDWSDYIDPQTGEPHPNIKVAAKLDWAVELDGASPPTQTVLHGLLYTVDWDTSASPPTPDDYPTKVSEQVRISIGNTAADALSALVRELAIADGKTPAQADAAAALFEAFQYDSLHDYDQPGGPARLGQTVHAAAFAEEAGGYGWTISPVTRSDTSSAAPQPVPSADQLQWLAELNANQQRLDDQREILASLQRQLVHIWWQNQRIGFTIPPQYNRPGYDNAKAQLPGQLDASDPDSLVSRVTAQQQLVDQLAALVPIPAGPGSAESIAAYSAGVLDPDELQLQSVQAPRYTRPADPVMLITGLGRSLRYGLDGILMCRTPDQLVTGISVNGAAITGSSLPAGTIPTVTGSDLPDSVDPLLVDSYFLDPGDAASIVWFGLDSTDPSTVAQVQDDIGARKDLIGKPPPSFAARAWAQPWLPLFLDWQVRFFFTFEGDGHGGFARDSRGDFIFDRDHWSFNGLDYDWTGGPLDLQHALSYSGRVHLTPQVEFVFLDRLRRYLETHPDSDLEEVEKLLEQLAQWDVLSQALSGLFDNLAMIDTGQNVAPPAAYEGLTPDGHTGVPLMSIVPDVDPSYGGGSPFFFPLRAGFLAFTGLRVVDAFGRSVDLLRANDNPGGSADTFYPIKAPALLADPKQLGADVAKRMIQLSPRINTGARLSLRWISSTDDQLPTDLAAAASPICGWLLPNHLDKSIAVYDALGDALGQLMTLVRSSDDQELIWRPEPGGQSSPVVQPDAPVEIANPHLLGLVNGLLEHVDAPQAFANFLAAIDETLWSVDPLGGRDDQNLSVLIGRPVAVTRVNLQLQLNGAPQYDQAWYKLFVDGGSTLLDDTGSVLEWDYPVRVGDQALHDDGVLGYFTGSDYSTFNAVHEPSDATPTSPPYVARIGVDGNYVQLQPKPTPTPPSEGSPFDSSQSVYLTLLVDPRGAVNCVTGLAPDRVAVLPDLLVQTAVEHMAMSFRAGPLLLDPAAVRLPSPAEQDGTWTWLQATGTAAGDWQEDPVMTSDGTADLAAAPAILREGWLRFTPNPPVDSGS